MTRVACIIPFGDMADGKGVSSRLQTLMFSLGSFYTKNEDTEIIIVGQNTYLAFLEDQPYKALVRPIYVKYPGFNKSWLVNVGARAARADYLIVAEADMWAQKPYFPAAIDWMRRRGLQWAFGWDRLFYVNAQEKGSILAGQPVRDRPSAIVRPTNGYSEGGFIMFRKRFFERIGGFNEWMENLGGIDNEICARCRHLTGMYPAYSQFVYHLWHEKVKTRHDPTRLKNVEILRYVQGRPKNCIRTIQKQDWGNKERPYSAVHGFATARKDLGL